jgi:acetyl-CoA acetyltransferase family protein
VALKSGIPESAPAFTVQRNCGSGLQALVSAYHEISAGNAATIIAGGVESMSSYPALFPKAFAQWHQMYRRANSKAAKLKLLRKFRFSYLKPLVSLQMALTDYMIEMNMALTADLLAKEFRISRKEQDEFALLSHHRAARATANSILKEEMVPVIAPPDYGIVAEEDDGIRKEQTAEQLANLPPLYEPYGTVSAGNASQISDGAAVLLMMNAGHARDLGYEPLAQVRSFAFAALNPNDMGIAPTHASARALQKAKMKYQDIQLTEINEAFASVVIANERLFADKRFVGDTFGQADLLSPIDREKLNVNGGAIAIGHPVGASAARIIITLLKEMGRRNAATGLAAMCIGGGQGGAIILEKK